MSFDVKDFGNFSGLKAEVAAVVNADVAAQAAPATPAATPAVATPASPTAPVTPAVPVTPSTPATPAAPVVQTPATPAIPGTPAVPATPVVPATPATPQTYSIDLGNGKTVELTGPQIAELQQNGLRHSDYTRKTQEVATARAEAAKILETLQTHQQQLAAAKELLSDPARMKAEAERRLAQMVPVDPNQPLTMAHAQQMTQRIAEALQQVEAQAVERIQKLEETAQKFVEDRITTAKYGETINQTLATIKQSHPILTKLPEFEDVIRYRVAQLEPATVEEAVGHFNAIASQIAKDLSGDVDARVAAAVAQRQVLAATATEPAGGNAPQPAQPTYVTHDGKVDWKKLTEAAKTFQ